MSDITVPIIVGLFAGFALGFAVMSLVVEETDDWVAYTTAIAQCKAKLPRNQHRVITAEPEEVK